MFRRNVVEFQRRVSKADPHRNTDHSGGLDEYRPFESRQVRPVCCAVLFAQGVEGIGPAFAYDYAVPEWGIGISPANVRHRLLATNRVVRGWCRVRSFSISWICRSTDWRDKNFCSLQCRDRRRLAEFLPGEKVHSLGNGTLVTGTNASGLASTLRRLCRRQAMRQFR